MIQSGITAGTPARIMFGAGVFFENATYSESVAPTEAEIIAGIIGATQEGGKVTITPELFNPDLDGALVPLVETEQKVGETAVMETSMVEIKPETIARAIIGVIKESTDKNYDVITSSELRKGHYYKGFGYYGELLDGRPFIVLFKNALNTAGFGLEGTNKNNAKHAASFACRSDIEYGVKKLPYALFVRKSKGWTPVAKEEITETA